MGWLSTIIVGFIVGLLARFLHPGEDKFGVIMTIILGIAGAALAGFVGEALGWYQVGEGAGWIASTIFAVIILAIYSRIVKKR